MKQRSALLNFRIVCCRVGEHPLRPSVCLLVPGEALSLTPERPLLCASRARRGSVLLGVLAFFCHLLFLVGEFYLREPPVLNNVRNVGRNTACARPGLSH